MFWCEFICVNTGFVKNICANVRAYELHGCQHEHIDKKEMITPDVETNLPPDWRA